MKSSIRKIIRLHLEELFTPKITSSLLSEAVACKVLPNIFNHLKWKLNETQKYFLDDFINYHPDTLRESDYKYASDRTGIPAENIKSIQNTCGSWNKPKNKVDNSYGRFTLGSGKAINAKEYDFEQKYRNDIVNFKAISKDEANNLRYPKKTKKQKEYESILGNSIKGLIKKSDTSKELNFDSWVMYYIVGKLTTKKHKLNEKNNTIEIDFEPTNDYYDFQKNMLNSNKKSKFWIDTEKLINDFNEVFGTEYVVIDQYDLSMSKSKSIRLVIKERDLSDKMIWDATDQRYVNWNQAPQHLKKEYLKNRPEKMVKEIPNVDFKELIDKYLNFDEFMFKGL